MTTEKSFRPLDKQPPLNAKDWIVENPPEHDNQVPMDVLFVGGGPAGLAGAIELSRLIQKDQESGGNLGEIEIGVLEKAQNLGGHSLSGAVMNPKVLRELFPDLSDKDFPLREKVKGDQVYYLTKSGKIRLPTPPTMHNKGNYVASICEVVRWLGEKAESMGVNVLTSFPADHLLVKNGSVQGVRTTPAGLNRDGQVGEQHMPATDVLSKVTVLSEGTRGLLTQAYCEWKGISSERPQIYALGVKELWKVKKVPKKVTHTMGWPLAADEFGGTWMYPMGGDHISLGLVMGLDYKNAHSDVHQKLQRMKEHPFFKQYLDGGECVEWGAKTIPEGGWHALPAQLHGDGLILAGDAAGFVNVPALKGIHYAMYSGILAARTIFEALKSGDYTSEVLKSYDQKIHDSFIKKDLWKVRNMRQAFEGGFYNGAVKAGLMTITGGTFPKAKGPFKEDAAHTKTIGHTSSSSKGLSKVDAVYKSGNKTRDDIPQHLILGKNISPELADFYSHMCPAGVYERDGDQLLVNAPNCVDCKATDVLGPRWAPREGGSGPDYESM